ARTREQGYSGNARWEWIASVKHAVKIPVIGNGDIRSPEDACAIVAQTGCDAVMIGRMAPANPWIFRQIEQYRAWMKDAGDDSGRNREGHDFSRAEHGASLTAALAAEGPSPSGAKALDFSSADGTTKVVPFPSLAIPGVSPLHRPYDEPAEADRYQMIRTYFQMLLEEGMPGAEGKMKQFASWFTHGVPGGAALRKAIYDAKSGAEILRSVELFFEDRQQLAAVTPP